MMKAINFSLQFLKRRLMAGNQGAHEFKWDKIRCQSLNCSILLDLHFMMVKPAITNQFFVWPGELPFQFLSHVGTTLFSSAVQSCPRITPEHSPRPYYCFIPWIMAFLICLWTYCGMQKLNYCLITATYRTFFIVSHLYLATVESINYAKWIFYFKKQRYL